MSSCRKMTYFSPCGGILLCRYQAPTFTPSSWPMESSHGRWKGSSSTSRSFTGSCWGTKPSCASLSPPGGECPALQTRWALGGCDNLFSFNNVLVWLHWSYLLCCKEKAAEFSLCKYLAAIVKICNLYVFNIYKWCKRLCWPGRHFGSQVISFWAEFALNLGKGYANGNCWCFTAFCWHGVDVGGLGLPSMGVSPAWAGLGVQEAGRVRGATGRDMMWVGKSILLWGMWEEDAGKGEIMRG